MKFLFPHLRHLDSSSVRDILYIALMSLFIMAAAGLFIWSVFFITRQINVAAGESEAQLTSPFGFDLVQFAVVAPRLGIPFTLESPLPSPEAAPGALTTESPVERISPSPSSSASPSREARVRILNGTFITGLAAQWKELLESQGIAIAEIGNAETRDYVGLTIRAKPSASEIVSKIKTISVSRNKQPVREGMEESSSPFDITVIVGQ